MTRPSWPENVRPRKGASWGRPCSWHFGVGEVVNVARRVLRGSVFGFGGSVRACRRFWIGDVRFVRGVILLLLS